MHVTKPVDQVPETSDFGNCNDYILTDGRKEELKTSCTVFLQSLKPSVDPGHPAEFVKSQGSEDWLKERQLRVTASNCKAVKTARTHQTKANVLKRMLSSNLVCTNEMTYGHENEKHALEDYSANLATVDASLHVEGSGLWVNPRFPELACSPGSVLNDRKGVSARSAYLMAVCD